MLQNPSPCVPKLLQTRGGNCSYSLIIEQPLLHLVWIILQHARHATNCLCLWIQAGCRKYLAPWTVRTAIGHYHAAFLSPLWAVCTKKCLQIRAQAEWNHLHQPGHWETQFSKRSKRHEQRTAVFLKLQGLANLELHQLFELFLLVGLNWLNCNDQESPLIPTVRTVRLILLPTAKLSKTFDRIWVLVWGSFKLCWVQLCFNTSFHCFFRIWFALWFSKCHCTIPMNDSYLLWVHIEIEIIEFGWVEPKAQFESWRCVMLEMCWHRPTSSNGIWADAIEGTSHQFFQLPAFTVDVIETTLEDLNLKSILLYWAEADAQS